MKRTPIIWFALLGAAPCRGQVSGNIGYAQGGGEARAEQAERAKRVLAPIDLPPNGTSLYVEANVLINVKPDEFVAVFGIAREGETVAECVRAMDDVVAEFTGAVKGLGIDDDALFVDFVAQNRVYGFEVAGDVAREEAVGFELKKNVSIHYKDRALLDRLVVAAARSQIFDLIKVDAIVADADRVRERLVEEAADVIARKRARYERLLGITTRPPAQVLAERPATYAPSEMYDSYTAAESEAMGLDRQRFAVQAARKSRTFFYNGLDADGFDRVINPVVLEPPVQFTLFLKVRYEIEGAKAEAPSR